jgi:hypothetical protein
MTSFSYLPLSQRQDDLLRTVLFMVHIRAMEPDMGLDITVETNCKARARTCLRFGRDRSTRWPVPALLHLSRESAYSSKLYQGVCRDV